MTTGDWIQLAILIAGFVTLLYSSSQSNKKEFQRLYDKIDSLRSNMVTQSNALRIEMDDEIEKLERKVMVEIEKLDKKYREKNEKCVRQMQEHLLFHAENGGQKQ
jgi:hypothetical protein